jgi:hypothetical protein
MATTEYNFNSFNNFKYLCRYLPPTCCTQSRQQLPFISSCGCVDLTFLYEDCSRAQKWLTLCIHVDPNRSWSVIRYKSATDPASFDGNAFLSNLIEHLSDPRASIIIIV